MRNTECDKNRKHKIMLAKIFNMNLNEQFGKVWLNICPDYNEKTKTK